MRRWMICVSLCLLALAATTGAQAQQAAQKRVALVIGNASYTQNPLKNPINDARAMATTLRQLGFQVIQRENATKTQMEQAVGEFGRALSKGGVAMFYYAGHGMQVNGRNFLIPTDATIEAEQSIRLEALDVDLVLDQIAGSGTDVNLVILDACRNNPFERRFRGSSGGLAQINAPKGTLIAYATAPGSVAADGDGANGLYTSKLVEAIKQPGLPVEEVFKRVRAGVTSASRDQQTPWEASSLVGNFYFLGPTTVVVNQPGAATAPAKAIAAQPQQQAAAPVAAPAASPFDGTWATVVTCDKAPDGARGYTIRFPSQVRNGELSGQFNSAATKAALQLRGTIGADGKALIYANGSTGNEELSIGRIKPGSPYAYTANTKFNGKDGAGTRNEVRACTLTFSKQ